MKAAWDFFQNQVLGMDWLNDLIGRLLNAAGLDIAGKIGASLQFFLYDLIKILVLLTVLIFIISYIQSHFPPERTKRILGRFKGVGANILSALLGTVTPFCSCSSIPIFIGFTNAGLPVGVTFSFLISSPLVDLGALVLLMGIFGAKIAIAYVVVGLILAVVGGILIDKLGMEKYVERFAGGTAVESSELTRKERFIYAREQTHEVVKKVWLYVIIGVGIGTLIHNWIPTQWIQNVLGQNNPFSVLIATAVGIPIKTLREIANGQKIPSSDEVEKLSKIKLSPTIENHFKEESNKQEVINNQSQDYGEYVQKVREETKSLAMSNPNEYLSEVINYMNGPCKEYWETLQSKNKLNLVVVVEEDNNKNKCIFTSYNVSGEENAYYIKDVSANPTIVNIMLDGNLKPIDCEILNKKEKT